MRHLVTAKEMKYLDKNTIEHFGVPEQVLIEQAAMAFVQEFVDILENPAQKGIVFCGSGNNGADGVSIARLLNDRGIQTEVCHVADILSKDTDIFTFEYDFVIDAIFGIGLSRDLSDEYISLIENINAMSGVKFAVDMPSGINSDNGQIMGAAVKCNYTITFAFEKRGAFLWPGNEYIGKLILAKIGITERSWLDENPTMVCLEEKDLCFLPKRTAHSNKGTYGKLLIIAGDVNMAGAAILSAKAAYRCGVGLVKVFTREENRIIIQTAVPEAILTTYTDDFKEEVLKDAISWADAIVIGPGLGQSDTAKRIVVSTHVNAKVPVLWDADALNLWAKNMAELQTAHADYVITPHLGEFSRMTGVDIFPLQTQFVEQAESFANEYNCVCVLKDFHSVIAVPHEIHFLNLSGNNGMATAGSGDVLTGIIGALLAQKMSTSKAAAYGVFIHGLAGDYARKEMGTHAMMASDIIDGLKNLWKKVDENAK